WGTILAPPGGPVDRREAIRFTYCSMIANDLRQACTRPPLQAKRHLRPDFQDPYPGYANTINS
ncbi:MAG TPA: hypothetical protein VIG57_04950, partial [Candidatus Entotheonella sp.]